MGPCRFSRSASLGDPGSPGRARRAGRTADRRRQERLLSGARHPARGRGAGRLAADRPDDRSGRGAEAAGRGRRPAGFRPDHGRAFRRLACGAVGRAGSAVCFARRTGVGVHAGASGRTAHQPDRHRRGALRQSVGPRLPSRLSHPGTPRRNLPACAPHRRHRHRRRPHARRHSGLAEVGRGPRLRRQLRPPEPAADRRAQGQRLARPHRRPRGRTGARTARPLGRGLLRQPRRLRAGGRRAARRRDQRHRLSRRL